MVCERITRFSWKSQHNIVLLFGVFASVHLSDWLMHLFRLILRAGHQRLMCSG